MLLAIPSHYSKPENHGSVTFSEKPEIDDVISQGLSRGMSHQMV